MDITNFNKDDLFKKGTDLIAGTNLASQLGITSTTSNLQQFYNRFSKDEVWKAEQLTYKINSTMYFDVRFKFFPHESKISALLREALVQSPEEDIKYFAQAITIPSFTVEAGDLQYSEAGQVSNPVSILKPSDNSITLSLLNTEYPLHEHVFYPWMRETTSNFWCYDLKPYTLADIEITILDSSSSEPLYTYILSNCHPTEIAAPTLTQEAVSELTRDITFTFNNMYFTSNNKITGSVLNQMFDQFVSGPLGDKISVLKSKIPRIPSL